MQLIGVDMEWRTAVLVLLVLRAPMAGGRLFEEAEGDLIIPEGSICTGYHGKSVFDLCCDFRFQLRHVWRAIQHGGSTEPGHAGCLKKSVLECCAINENRRRRVLPWYNQGLLTIRVRSRLFGKDHYLRVVQPSALNWWSERFIDMSRPKFSRSFPRFNLSVKTGAGLLWDHGYFLGQVIAQLHLNLPPDAVHFLDVGAGTGFASLVALLRGWRVLSTDYIAESGRARRYSAMASFGNSSVLERFQTAELDLLDNDTWPKTNANVICATHFTEELSAALPLLLQFRSLVASRLADGGVGLFSFTFHEDRTEEYVRHVLPKFLDPGNGILDTSLYRHGRHSVAGKWFPIEIREVSHEDVNLVVFQRRGSLESA